MDSGEPRSVKNEQVRSSYEFLARQDTEQKRRYIAKTMDSADLNRLPISQSGKNARPMHRANLEEAALQYTTTGICELKDVTDTTVRPALMIRMESNPEKSNQSPMLVTVGQMVHDLGCGLDHLLTSTDFSSLHRNKGSQWQCPSLKPVSSYHRPYHHC